MESILLNLLRGEFDAEQAVRQPAFSYQLPERKQRQQTVGFRLGELLSAEIDITYLLARALKADECAVQTRIDHKRHSVGTREHEIVQRRQQPGRHNYRKGDDYIF